MDWYAPGHAHAKQQERPGTIESKNFPTLRVMGLRAPLRGKGGGRMPGAAEFRISNDPFLTSVNAPQQEARVKQATPRIH